MPCVFTVNLHSKYLKYTEFYLITLRAIELPIFFKQKIDPLLNWQKNCLCVYVPVTNQPYCFLRVLPFLSLRTCGVKYSVLES